jgi:hypothetical protein
VGVDSDKLRDGGARVEQAANEVDQLEQSKGDQSSGEAVGCAELGDSDSSLVAARGGRLGTARWHCARPTGRRKER